VDRADYRPKIEESANVQSLTVRDGRSRTKLRLRTPARPFCAEACGMKLPMSIHRRPILPRSRHLPVASTEGSLARNLNRIGVRLWADCSRPWTAETD
jgi:hypothetical protein